MFGLDSPLLKPVLASFKNKIKKAGIKFIAVIPDEQGDLNTRAFTVPCGVMPMDTPDILLNICNRMESYCNGGDGSVKDYEAQIRRIAENLKELNDLTKKPDQTDGTK